MQWWQVWKHSWHIVGYVVHISGRSCLITNNTGGSKAKHFNPTNSIIMLDFLLHCWLYLSMAVFIFRPRGKESTKVWITQNIEKRKGNLLPKNEDISGGKAHT